MYILGRVHVFWVEKKTLAGGVVPVHLICMPSVYNTQLDRKSVSFFFYTLLPIYPAGHVGNNV